MQFLMILRQITKYEQEFGDNKIRCSIVVSISACHAEDPGSIPGGGVLMSHMLGDLIPRFICFDLVCELNWVSAQ